MIELTIRVENPSKELEEALQTFVTKATADPLVRGTEQAVIGGATIPITVLGYDQTLTLSSSYRTEHSYSFLAK